MSIGNLRVECRMGDTSLRITNRDLLDIEFNADGVVCMSICSCCLDLAIIAITEHILLVSSTLDDHPDFLWTYQSPT